jgi:hypothetical protein
MGHWNSSCDQKILFILSLDLSVARFVSVRLSFDFRVGAFSFSVALAVAENLQSQKTETKHQNGSEVPVKQFTISKGNQRKEFVTIL